LLALRKLCIFRGISWKAQKYIYQINHFSSIKIWDNYNYRNNWKRAFGILSIIFWDLIISEEKKRVNGSTMTVMIAKNLC